MGEARLGGVGGSIAGMPEGLASEQLRVCLLGDLGKGT